MFMLPSLLLAVSLGFSLCNASIVQLWSAEHLDDLIVSDAFNRSVPAALPAVIAFYQTPCKEALFHRVEFNSWNFFSRERKPETLLPLSTSLLLASYDDLYVRSRPWYTWYDHSMNLAHRYNITFDHSCEMSSDSSETAGINSQSEQWDCCIEHNIQLVFQPSNWSQPVQYYKFDPNVPLVKWIWQQLSINITFENDHDASKKTPDVVGIYRVGVDRYHYENLRQKQQNSEKIVEKNDVVMSEELVGTIAPGESLFVTNKLFVSDLIVFRLMNGGWKVIQQNVLNDAIGYLKVSSDTQEIENYEEIFREKLETDLEVKQKRDWDMRRRFLKNIKTPPLMPNFTKMGFARRSMPAGLCERLQKFYNDNINNTVSTGKDNTEYFPVDSTIINTEEATVKILHLPEKEKLRIADEIKPLLEEWTGQELVYSTLYGERVYFKGSVLKSHVDKIKTHITSTILHIKHEPVEVDWPIEVTSYDGNRYYVKDRECDMVFYESHKVIHGRPFTYKGDYWVNAFLHFRPKNWSGYYNSPDNVVVTPTARVPLVDNVYG